MGLMLFSFPRDFGTTPWRRRLSRALVSLHVLSAVMFPLPAIIAELFQDPLLTKQSAGATIVETAKDAERVTLATIGGAALVNAASPITVPGRAPLRPQVRPLVPIGAQFRVLATAYSSTPDQTDSSPFITASGTHVHDGTVATNFLPFGSRVRFHNYRPDMVFTVEDRHSPRLSDRVDIWFTSRGEALRFGKRVLEMEIAE